MKILKNKNGFFAGITLTLLAATATAEARGYGDEVKAKGLVRSNAEAILTFAHPTVTFLSVTVGDATGDSFGGFSVDARMRWISAFDNRGFTDFTFYFDRTGVFSSFEAIRTSALVRPFEFSGAVIRVVREAIERECQAELREDPFLRALIRRADAKSILTAFLRIEYLTS